jgi:hypothetical protein
MRVSRPQSDLILVGLAPSEFGTRRLRNSEIRSRSLTRYPIGIGARADRSGRSGRCSASRSPRRTPAHRR